MVSPGDQPNVFKLLTKKMFLNLDYLNFEVYLTNKET